MPDFQFDSFQDFISMGGYAIYVWPVYLLFVLFFVVNIIPPLVSRRKIITQLRARQLREEHEEER